jgi:hypothetical protein
MRRLFALLLILPLCGFLLRSPGSGSSAAPASDPLQSLIGGNSSGMCASNPTTPYHNCWKLLSYSTTGGQDVTPQIAQTAANFDGGYATATWASGTGTSIVVSGVSGTIVVGDAVQGTGTTPNWVTAVAGDDLTLASATGGSPGGSLTFSSLTTNGGACGHYSLWAYGGPALRLDLGKVKVAGQGGGHSDGCDSGVYMFDVEACANAINQNSGSGTCNGTVGWTNPVKTGRFVPIYYNGSAVPPAWSCQMPDANAPAIATFTSGAGQSGNPITLNYYQYYWGSLLGANEQASVGSSIWGAGIPPGATIATINQVGTYEQQVTLAGGATTTQDESGGTNVMTTDGGPTLFALLATTTAGSTSITTNVNIPSGYSNYFTSGPTIAAGTTIASGSGTTSGTLSYAAIGNQTMGPIFISQLFGWTTTNADGIENEDAMHTYFDEAAVPGTTKWLLGSGSYGYTPDPAAGGHGTAYLFDESTDSFQQQGSAPNNCMIGFGLPVVNDLDGLVWNGQASLGYYTNPYGTAMPAYHQLVASGGTNAYSQSVLIHDPVNGSSERAIFQDLSGNTTANGFQVWTGIACASPPCNNGNPASCSPSCTEYNGTFTPAPSTVFSSSTSEARGACTDGTYIYEWEATGIIFKITPNSTPGSVAWGLAALNSSPSGDIPEEESSDPYDAVRLGCLGEAYQGAFLAFANGTIHPSGIWVYKP